MHKALPQAFWETGTHTAALFLLNQVKMTKNQIPTLLQTYSPCMPPSA